MAAVFFIAYAVRLPRPRSRPGEPEVYAETADLHERCSPGTSGSCGRIEETLAGVIRPSEDEVRATSERGRLCWPSPFDLAVPSTRTGSPRTPTQLHRRAGPRSQMGDRVPRRYLAGIRVGQRAE